MPGTCQHLVPQAFPYQPDESPQKLCFLLLLARLLRFSIHRLTWLWLSHWRLAGQWRWETTGVWPGWLRDGRLTKATKTGWSLKIEQIVTAALCLLSPPFVAVCYFDKVTYTEWFSWQCVTHGSLSCCDLWFMSNVSCTEKYLGYLKNSFAQKRKYLIVMKKRNLPLCLQRFILHYINAGG